MKYNPKKNYVMQCIIYRNKLNKTPKFNLIKRFYFFYMWKKNCFLLYEERSK